MIHPIKYTGTYSYEDEEHTIKRFLFHKPHKIIFDFTSEGYEYAVELFSEDGIIFKGEFHVSSDGERGVVTGTIVTLLDDELYIVGEWFESREQGRWHARLTTVVHFDDETESTSIHASV